MKVAFVSSEVSPFAKTGGLGEVCGALPLELEKLGDEIIIILPGYGLIDRKTHNIQKSKIWGFSETTVGRNIKVYFVDHDGYFGRDGIYGDSKNDYPDNLQRFQYFCAQTLKLFKELDQKIDIIHCHDWQAALIPVYLKSIYKDDKFFKKTKTVMTIHNMAYQGIFPGEQFVDLGLDRKFFNSDSLEFYGNANLLKGGLIFADVVTTVSPTYAKEILSQPLGSGLEGVVRHRRNKVIGILNGLDYSVWDSQHDLYLTKTYSEGDPEGKAPNKAALQKEFGLPVKSDIPLFGFVGRLIHQKGLDLIEKSLEALEDLNLQMVFLGVGDYTYHQALRRWTKTYPKTIAANLVFDDGEAHRIYAGSDFFLMPSVYEPCGLSQMVSLRYGTIPIVHKTGGLADTIVPYDASHETGNGFVFLELSEKAFLAAVKQALAVYANKKLFQQLVKRAFSHDFSWDRSAREYQKVYSACLL